MIALLLLLAQADGWSATPAAPTVGDTIKLERTIAAPAGWRVRAGRLPSGAVAEPLSDAVIIPSGSGGWTVRYVVVAWGPGEIALDMPPLWRLGPDGSADSLAGGTATFRVASVIPDSVRSPVPQPSLGPLRLQRASPIPVLAAVLLAAGALLLLIGWRRRAPRLGIEESALTLDAEVPDQRWLGAGEPKAVAARATHQLRSAVARAVPSAHEALSTTECLVAVEHAWPNAPLRDLRELLQALDQVAFATAHGVDVAPLAARARALARELGGNGSRKTK
ncbi:MAG: hypothetical protein ACREMI_00535 [Gemmatimonadales bacterium]